MWTLQETVESIRKRRNPEHSSAKWASLNQPHQFQALLVHPEQVSHDHLLFLQWVNLDHHLQSDYPDQEQFTFRLRERAGSY